jgi:hypothetical protein
MWFFLRRSRRKREARLQETEKRARAGTAVGFLPGDAQQKNEQVENVSIL